MQLNEFILSLRSRKIGQTVVVYLGSGWVVLEAFGFFSQRYNWDQRLFDTFLVLLLFGLPATIFIQWFHYAEDRNKTRKKEMLLYTVNLLLAGFFAAQAWVASPRVARAPVESERSIAVLPFANLSRDPEQEYFSDGITEDIISKLYKIANLQVTSRTSVLMYKNTTKTIQQIASELGVAYVLEGSVQRAVDKVRITARLIKANDDRNVWTDSFDNELRDVFAVQTEVAQRIAEELKITLTAGEKELIQKIPTTNTLAYEYYQQGKFYLAQQGSRQNIERSKDLFQKAIELDSNFAAAYTGLAEVYITYLDWGYAPPSEVMQLIIDYIEAALEIDNMSGEAYTALATYYIYHEHDLAKAEEVLDRAIKLNPGYDVTYFRYAFLAISLKQSDRSLQFLEKAIMLNPLSAKYRGYKVQHFYLFRDYERALMETNKALELFPNDDFLLWMQGRVYCEMKRYDESIESFLKRSVATRDKNWALGYTYARAGKRDKALEIIDYLVEKSKTTYIPPSFIAVVYLGLGDRDNALKFLNKSADVNDYWLVSYDQEPWFDDVRDDPGFIAVRARIFEGSPIK